MNILYLYSTLGCHLCEDAKQILWALLQERALTLKEVDIADDPALQNIYGIRIPVIRLENRNDELGWPFTATQARDYLDAD